jgi:5-methylcytosine-specific restriction endonuclease McrA
MIVITRGPELLALTQARRRHLARALRAWRASPQPTARPEHASLDDGYDVARKELWHRQNKKCAYCEKRDYVTASPVEHFRPRRGADLWLTGETPRARDETRYWWLAWTWENLLFTCNTCNCAANKGNRFPVARPSCLLPPPPRTLQNEAALTQSFDLTAEDGGRMMLDPARDDPRDHLAWVPYVGARRATPDDPTEEIDWRATGRTPLGWNTIHALGLDRDAQDAVNDHLRAFVHRRAVEIRREALKPPPSASAQHLWTGLLGDLFDPNSSFHAASWCALDFWLPASMRSQHQLPAPMFSSPSSAQMAPIFDDGGVSALMNGLASIDLRLQVRAFAAVDMAETRSLIVAVCSARPCTTSELALLLDLKPETVFNHCSALTATLTLTGDRWVASL